MVSLYSVSEIIKEQKSLFFEEATENLPMLLKIVLDDGMAFYMPTVLSRMRERNPRCIIVRGYSSRSGAHWEKAYIVSPEGETKEVTGTFKILADVLTYYPIAREDLEKPIPREGKNVVLLDIEEFRDYHLELGRDVAKQIGEKVLLLSNEEGCTVCLYQTSPDLTVMPYFHDIQGNLRIYRVDDRLSEIISELERLKKTMLELHELTPEWLSEYVDDTLTIIAPTLEYGHSVYDAVVLAQFTSQRHLVYLVAPRYSEITVSSKRHGTLTLPQGYYILYHLVPFLGTD